MNLEAFIFCLDGVLIETDDDNYHAWKRLADEVGADFDRGIFKKLGRVSRRDAAEVIFEDQDMSETEVQAALDRQNNFYHERILKMSPGDVLMGVVDLLKELRSANIKIGLYSEHKDAKKALDAVGLTPLVDVIGDGDSVKETMPEPDLLLYVAHEMGVKPENCVVIESHPKGIEASNRAGMYAVGIGRPEQLSGSDLVYASLESVTLDQIRNNLEKARPY